VSDFLDLMNPEAIARLRHALRTPLNHLIGYAEMVREEAREQSDDAAGAEMDRVLDAARKMVEQVQFALPVRAHIAEDAIPTLQAALRYSLERVHRSLAAFVDLTGGACENEVRKMRAAAAELADFTVRPEPAPSPPEDPVTAIPLPPASEPSAAGGGSGRILVVDDDQDNREILVRRLEREGYDAAAEPDGAAALARLSRESFDLVLLDIYMPVMDGFQVLAELKRRFELQDMPVIVLSALDDHANAVRSIEMGAEDFLAKPYDAVILRARIGAILKRRRAETERARMAESLQLLLESTGEGVFGEDAEGRCVFVNRAALEMLGVRREDLLGRGLHAALHHTRPDGSPYPENACPIRAVVRTGEPRRVRDEVFFRGDGSSFPVEYSAHPIRRDGKSEGVVVTFTDITERKRSEESILQSAKLESLGVLAGGIAHDFNNILTGIIGNSSLVLESLPKSDPNRGLLDDVVAAGERAADLTRQMLAFAGKGQIAIEAVDLSQAIQDISELLAATLTKTTKLALNLAPHVSPVEADPRQIQQLVFNLVINAGEAIGDRGGVVTVETGMRDLPQGAPAEPPSGRLAAGTYVFAAVSDTGPGIDDRTRARIFDPFFSTKFAGRGLGLPAAMGIARAHRGVIRVESKPGQGSRFEVLLPVARSRVFHMPAARELAQLESPARGVILVVDDEEVVRRTTRAVLEHKGYRVLLAENGQQAIDLFRERASEISLILLDLTMPVMGGEEAARYLHAIRHDVPILVSSGYQESEVARRFSGSRVAGYVRKPYTAAALLDRIQSVVG
jgi:PAS domain S-box-containing protein